MFDQCLIIQIANSLDFDDFRQSFCIPGFYMNSY